MVANEKSNHHCFNTSDCELRGFGRERAAGGRGTAKDLTAGHRRLAKRQTASPNANGSGIFGKLHSGREP